MPSGEIRRIIESALATIGQVGNIDHMNVSSGKAGRTRWQGRRPHVRGMVMNPVDHPMGGGQGKSKGGGGRHHPMSPWGQLAKGFKAASTRVLKFTSPQRKHKSTVSKFIVALVAGKKQRNAGECAQEDELNPLPPLQGGAVTFAQIKRTLREAN